MKRLPLLLLASFLVSCGNDRLAGASTETTNGVSGDVYGPDGSATASARVRLTDATGSRFIYETRTDPRGHWTADLPSGTYGLLVEASGGTKSWTYPRALDKASIPSIYTSPTGGLVVPSGRSELAATPFSSSTGRFDSLPSGSYTALLDSGSSPWPLGSVRIQSNAISVLDTTRDTGLLFDDFDAGNAGFLYAAWHPGRRWFAQNGPTGTLISPAADGGVTGSLDTVGAWRGRSLSIYYTSEDTGSFVQVGHYFPYVSDFSTLKAVRLRAKGNGVLRVYLAGSAADNSVIRTQWQAVPTGTWTEFVFRPGAELPSGPSDPPRVAWSAISSGVWLLMIQAYGGTELHVDDIRLEGIPASLFLDAGQ